MLDRRTTLGKQLAAWRRDLVRDLGGDPSTAQLAIIELAVRTKLMLDSIDAWLLTQASLVNLRKRALLPVVRERQGLADALARYLGQLGLERRSKDVPDLTTYLAEAARRETSGPGIEGETRQEMTQETPPAEDRREIPSRPSTSSKAAPIGHVSVDGLSDTPSTPSSTSST